MQIKNKNSVAGVKKQNTVAKRREKLKHNGKVAKNLKPCHV